MSNRPHPSFAEIPGRLPFDSGTLGRGLVLYHLLQGPGGAGIRRIGVLNRLSVVDTKEKEVTTAAQGFALDQIDLTRFQNFPHFQRLLKTLNSFKFWFDL